MLTPREGVWVKIDDMTAVDGSGLRDFLRVGFDWNLDPIPAEVLPDAQREAFQLNLARLALALVDAGRSDPAGVNDIGRAIVAEVKRREEEKEANDAI